MLLHSGITGELRGREVRILRFLGIIQVDTVIRSPKLVRLRQFETESPQLSPLLYALHKLLPTVTRPSIVPYAWRQPIFTVYREISEGSCTASSLTVSKVSLRIQVVIYTFPTCQSVSQYTDDLLTAATELWILCNCHFYTVTVYQEMSCLIFLLVFCFCLVSLFII